MIVPPSGVRVWLATGATDMRRGMNSLALQVQEALHRDPHAGDLYVFRGKRGDLLKILGMMVSGCRCMPKGWSAAGSSGHHRPTVSFRSQLHSLATCSRGSTGDIRNKPGVRWQRDEPKNIRPGAQDIVAAHERCVIPCGRGGRDCRPAERR